MIFDKERQGFFRPKCAFLILIQSDVYVPPSTNYSENSSSYGDKYSHGLLNFLSNWYNDSA